MTMTMTVSQSDTLISVSLHMSEKEIESLEEWCGAKDVYSSASNAIGTAITHYLEREGRLEKQSGYAHSVSTGTSQSWGSSTSSSSQSTSHTVTESHGVSSGQSFGINRASQSNAISYSMPKDMLTSEYRTAIEDDGSSPLQADIRDALKEWVNYENAPLELG